MRKIKHNAAQMNAIKLESTWMRRPLETREDQNLLHPGVLEHHLHGVPVPLAEPPDLGALHKVPPLAHLLPFLRHLRHLRGHPLEVPLGAAVLQPHQLGDLLRGRGRRRRGARPLERRDARLALEAGVHLAQQFLDRARDLRVRGGEAEHGAAERGRLGGREV
jgi:hypothetical protein